MISFLNAEAQDRRRAMLRSAMGPAIAAALADPAARAVGRERFQAFVDQVGRQIAGGGRTLGGKAEREDAS